MTRPEQSPPQRVRLPDGRPAGIHMPVAMGLVRVVERAHHIGASAIQIFSDNPTAWQRRAEPPREVARYRERLRQLEIGPVAIHASYLINLAGPDDTLFARSVALLRHELELAPEYQASFVNVHIGSHRASGVETGMRRLVDGIRQASGGLAAAQTSLIVLENSSGGGFAVGSTIEELAQILDLAAASGLSVRFCLDSAHLWGAGYDVGDPDRVDELLVRFDRLIGLDRLAMIHLNDSHSPLGSRKDRHAHIGDGQIDIRGLARLLCHPALAHVAYYLETPEMEKGYDAINVARLGDLAAGRPLTPAPEPLPDEAPRSASVVESAGEV